ncbi:MAG: rhodanese-like domain-containing protein [Massilia sp.]
MVPHHPPRPVGFRSDLPRWQQLVSPRWLAGLLAGAEIEAAPARGWRLLEPGCGGAADFARGHIAGAAYLDTAQLEHEPLWNKIADDALLALLLGLGIRHDTTVILYGRNNLAAARAAHLMLYAGVRDVRLLDGGLQAWCAADLPLVQGAPARCEPAAGFGCPFPARPDYLVDITQVRRLLARADASVVSIRTREEFIGASSGYRYIAVNGDIPGARWGHSGEDGDINSMSAFLDARGCMLPAAAITAMWAASGIHPDQEVTFYCGTGWRASLAFFYAWLMGWERIGVYEGGWFEWSRDPANPVTCRVAEQGALPLAGAAA